MEHPEYAEIEIPMSDADKYGVDVRPAVEFIPDEESEE